MLSPILNSKPSAPGLLRYPVEYQNALSVLGRKEWPALKNKLSSADADQVVIALNAFVDAIVANKAAIENHDDFDCQRFPSTNDMTILTERWNEMNRLRRECRYARREQRLTRYNLMALLVGKENLCVDDDYDDDEDNDL